MTKAAIILFSFILLCPAIYYGLLYWAGYYGDLSLAMLAPCGLLICLLCLAGLLGLLIAALFRRQHRKLTGSLFLSAILISGFLIPFEGSHFNLAHGLRDRVGKDFALERLRLIAHDAAAKACSGRLVHVPQKEFRYAPYVQMNEGHVVRLFWMTDWTLPWGFLISLDGPLPPRKGFFLLPIADDIAIFQL